MKQKIRIWTLRLTATALLLLGFLVGIALNPSLLYTSNTTSDNYTIYHSSPLEKDFNSQLHKSIELIKTSELYNSTLKLEICLNDGSYYPTLMEKARGQAFAWGFYNKVVLMGTLNSRENYVELNGYKWNLIQLLAHEQTHCFQFNKFGLWKSNPIARYPAWKWEGYPEYVARRNADQINLAKNVERIIETDKTDKEGWAVTFADNTVASKEYYHYWLLVQYCLDIKKMSYENLLKDTTSEQVVTEQMMKWFAEQNVNW